MAMPEVSMIFHVTCLVMACHLLPLLSPVSVPLSIRVDMLWLPFSLPISSEDLHANRNNMSAQI